jgi:hypothetical protein
VLLLAALTLAAQAAAQSQPPVGQVGISPPIQIVTADGPLQTHSYRLHNMGSEAVQVQVSVVNWTADEDGKTIELPPEGLSLDQWIVINPVNLLLPAGESRAVRFSIRPAVELPVGEHRAAVIFQQVTAPGETREQEAPGLVFRTRFRLSSAVYATVGEVTRSGRVLDLTLSPTRLDVLVESLGNGHVRLDGQWQLWETGAFDAAGESQPRPQPLRSGALGAASVQPGLKRRVAHSLEAPLAPGRYTVELLGTLGDQPVKLIRSFQLKAA